MLYEERFFNGNKSSYSIEPKGVVLHHIDLPIYDIVSLFTEKAGVLSCGTTFKGVSAHCLILKDGTRFIFGDDTDRMWHAGQSKFKGIFGCNDFMLGVEFEGDTNKKPLTFDQITSFHEWFLPRMIKHDIKKGWVTDHRTIAPERKVDLNPFELQKVLNSIENVWG